MNSIFNRYGYLTFSCYKLDCYLLTLKSLVKGGVKACALVDHLRLI